MNVMDFAQESFQYTGISNSKRFSEKSEKIRYILMYAYDFKKKKWHLLISAPSRYDAEVVDENNVEMAAFLMTPFNCGLGYGYRRILDAIEKFPDKEYFQLLIEKVEELKLNIKESKYYKKGVEK